MNAEVPIAGGDDSTLKNNGENVNEEGKMSTVQFSTNDVKQQHKFKKRGEGPKKVLKKLGLGHFTQAIIT